MKLFGILAALGLAPMLSLAEEESGAQRIENAREGMAEASWPKKPDGRISSLSGKMKDVATLSPRYYGQGREFAVRRLDDWNRESFFGQRPAWEGSVSSGQTQARWEKSGKISETGGRSSGFQPDTDGAPLPKVTWNPIEKKPAPDWSTRAALVSPGERGGLQTYEGRLTRVRERVAREGEEARDLGPGRQEKFRPEEVEKILSQPVGARKDAPKEQFPGAFPPVAEDN